MSIFVLKFGMTQIQESMDVTSRGKLSSVLISPHYLSDILYCKIAAVYAVAKCMYTVPLLQYMLLRNVCKLKGSCGICY